jgi:hypothetical protein
MGLVALGGLKPPATSPLDFPLVIGALGLLCDVSHYFCFWYYEMNNTFVEYPKLLGLAIEPHTIIWTN